MAGGDGERASKEEDGPLDVQSRTYSAEVEDEEDENGIGSFLQIFQHSPVEITTRNKVICSSAFSVLILALVGFVIALALYHVNFHYVVEHSHFFGPVCAIYVLLGSDILASLIGIWTCVAKTGPKAMIFTCIWLLLSSLFHICSAALLHMNIEFKQENNGGNGTTTESTGMTMRPETTTSHYSPAKCKNVKNEEECDAAAELTTIIWCSLVVILLKMLAIGLCRVNYPQVFNWLLNKQVLLDEEIVEQAVKSLTNIGALGGAYFAPCDIERLAARGSLYGTDVEKSSSKTILVQRTITEDDENQETANQRRKSRRATLISSSLN